MPDGAKHKVTRFFLKAIDIPSNSQTTPLAADTRATNATTYINFMTKYYWVEPTICYLDIGWEPWAPDANTNTHYQTLIDDSSVDDNDNNFLEPYVVVQVIGNGYGYNQATPLPDNINQRNYQKLNIPANTILNNAGTLKDDAILALKLKIEFDTGEDRNFNIGFGYLNIVEDGDHKYYYSVNKKTDSTDTFNKYVTIPAPSRYENNVIFNEAGINDLIKNIKEYPVVDVDEVPESRWINGNPSILVIHGAEPRFIKTPDTSLTSGKVYYTFNSTNNQYTIVDTPNVSNIGNYYEPKDAKQVKVGSNVKIFATDADLNTATPSYITEISKVNNQYPAQAAGTFRINVNNKFYQVPIKGWGDMATASSVNDINTLLRGTNGYFLCGRGTSTDPVWTNELGANFLPTIHNTYNLGAAEQRWQHLYLSGKIAMTSTAGYTGAAEKPDNTTYNENAIHCLGGAYFAKNLSAMRVFNAVFNDYAECRTTIDLAPGHVVIDNDDGSLSCSSARLQPGAQIISDTYGHLMGGTEIATTPIAVAGRVLVYTYQPRENYHAGMAVCSAPDGTVDIMTREEIRDYPDCIVGIVSEIPQYETWGSDNVKVDGRIWIKVR